MKCRHCNTIVTRKMLDLGYAPLSNAYRSVAHLDLPEITYPLRLFVCDTCKLVQTQDFTTAELVFQADYAYFSSTSTSYLRHAADYAKMITRRLGLHAGSFVIEVASNDGYLLKNFVAAGIPCLGVEPTDSTAEAAEQQGIPVLRRFFGEALGKELAAEGKVVDLVCGNNVFAHVPDINDFTLGLAAILKPEGVVTLEFPHLMQYIEHCQFDTTYHEHYSYLSLSVTKRIFENAGLRLFDVEELPTHGGSLRVYGCRDDARYQTQPAVDALIVKETAHGLFGEEVYTKFQQRAEKIKNDLLAFLVCAKQAGHSIAAYGAAAKGSTLLNFAGVKPDLLPFICDAAASKQGQSMPGSHIPIMAPEELYKSHLDYVLILPWNIAEEVRAQLAPLAEKGTKFVTAIPELVVT